MTFLTYISIHKNSNIWSCRRPQTVSVLLWELSEWVAKPRWQTAVEWRSLFAEQCSAIFNFLFVARSSPHTSKTTQAELVEWGRYGLQLGAKPVEIQSKLFLLMGGLSLCILVSLWTRESTNPQSDGVRKVSPALLLGEVVYGFMVPRMKSIIEEGDTKRLSSDRDVSFAVSNNTVNFPHSCFVLPVCHFVCVLYFACVCVLSLPTRELDPDGVYWLRFSLLSVLQFFFWKGSQAFKALFVNCLSKTSNGIPLVLKWISHFYFRKDIPVMVLWFSLLRFYKLFSLHDLLKIDPFHFSRKLI